MELERVRLAFAVGTASWQHPSVCYWPISDKGRNLMRKKAWALSPLVAVALAAGCGGGGGGGGGSEDRLTREEFVAAADAACKAANDEIDALAEPTSLAEAGTFLEQVLPIQEDLVATLRGLRPPEVDQAKVDEAIGLLEQQLDVARDLQAAVDDGDEAKFTEIYEQGDPIDEQVDEIAKELGLVECGTS